MRAPSGVQWKAHPCCSTRRPTLSTDGVSGRTRILALAFRSGMNTSTVSAASMMPFAVARRTA